MIWLPAATLFVIGLLLYVTSASHVLGFGPQADALGRSSPAAAAPRVESVGAAEGQPAVDGRAVGGRAVGGRAVDGRDTGRPADGSHASRAEVPRTIDLWSGEDTAGRRFEIPIPVGALVRERDDRPGAADGSGPDRAMVATAGDVNDVLAFYRAELATRGWQEVRSWMSRSPDGESQPGRAISAFCQGADSPALLLVVVSPEAGVSQLQLRIAGERPGPCGGSPSDPWNSQPPPMF